MTEQIIITLIVFVAWMATVGAAVYIAVLFRGAVKDIADAQRYAQDAETDRQRVPEKRA